MAPCSGYTAVTCVAPGCGTTSWGTTSWGPTDDGTVAGPLAAALREVVGTSHQGVLVSAGCLLGAAVCSRRPVAPVVVVQPCDGERRPTSCALAIGPLRTDADVDALVTWLRAGDLDPLRLPEHLLDGPRVRRG